jgi:hypothetical protein
MTADTPAGAKPSLLRARLVWAFASAPAFAVGWATLGALGEVVGEALGGDFLHQLGHGVGTLVLIAILSLAGWLSAHRRAAWITRWAVSAVAGCAVGLAVYVFVLALAPDSLADLTIALSLFLPLLTSVLAQWWALSGQVRAPGLWAAAWFLGILLGAVGAWFSNGGLEGADAAAVHPMLSQAAQYWWRMVPSSVLGGLLFATWTALTVPLGRSLHRRAPTAVAA